MAKSSYSVFLRLNPANVSLVNAEFGSDPRVDLQPQSCHGARLLLTDSIPIDQPEAENTILVAPEGKIGEISPKTRHLIGITVMTLKSALEAIRSVSGSKSLKAPRRDAKGAPALMAAYA